MTNHKTMATERYDGNISLDPSVRIGGNGSGILAGVFVDKRIDEALSLLNEVARDKRRELKEMIRVKRDNLKATLADRGEAVQKKVAEVYHLGKDKVTEKTRRIDESVHQYPWHFIGGVALTTLIFGYLFRRPNR